MVPGENTQICNLEGIHSTAAADEPRALCIIRDFSNSETTGVKATINLPASTTAAQLMNVAAEQYMYKPNSFELLLQRASDKKMICINDCNDETLESLGFQCDTGKNNLIISDKNDGPPEPADADVARIRSNNHESYEGSGDTSSTYVPPPAPPPYTLGSSSDFSYNYSYSSALIRQETGFVGLVNQAMTCYLNSLLQTLYMTPEFRNALYRWEFDGTEEEGSKSIPYQLQKLFLQLQTSKKPAVGTTELTTSFGWDSSEAWQQHDVQELCRVMFDALEQKFKNTEQADLISTLYEGKLKDYVKCLECGYESARKDTFLDVPLVVRPFGSNQAYGSVEEALHAFVTPETLEGSNQYFCEQCNKKCDAHKGLKFVKFPYLLTLQLKRFDFDPSSMHRIKLNDRVSFPEILNLNEFMKPETIEDVVDDGDTTDSGSALDDEGLCCSGGFKTNYSLSPETAVTSIDPADDDEGIDVDLSAPSNFGNNHELSVNERNLRKSMEKGPYVYELFSIMVHSGSANGGHYYAYIKSFNDGEWYCFNDAQVSKITYDDIQKTYGGGPTRGYYSRYSSSTNAYMLMYRKIDKDKNAEYLSAEDFPEHIKVLLQCMQEQEERERQQRELDRYMCKIKLFCQHPTRQMVEMKLKVHKDCTLAEATATAHKIMGLEGIVPLECCRLVKYDDFHDSLESSFDGSDDEHIGDLLGGVKSSYKFDLFLEIRKPHEQFQEYKPGGTTVKIHVVDLELENVSPLPFPIRCNIFDTKEEFKSRVAKLLGVDESNMRLVLEGYNGEMKLLSPADKTLRFAGFARSSKVFVEYKDLADAQLPFTSSKLYRTLDCYAHTMCLHIALPKVDKAILERLRIPENDVDEGKDDSNGEDEGCENSYVALVPQNCRDGQRNCTESCSLDVQSAVCRSTSSELNKKNPISVTPDDSSQDYDEGLGDSEIGDTCSTNGYHSNQAVHSDQSEDSSLTDSERTLVGDELSPRNNSPDVMGSEMEADSESLPLSNLEVSKPECDCAHSSRNFILNEQTEDGRNLSSPEENTKNTTYNFHSSLPKPCTCNNSVPAQSEEVFRRFFKAYPYTDCETGEKMLRVYVDKRITLASVKKELEPHVGISADCFKIYRKYAYNQALECTRLKENLMSYSEDTKLVVKLGRALRKSEFKVKIYQLCVSETEFCKYLVDWVFVKGMTVLQAKKEILPEIQEKCNIDIPLNRCRLRKKSWKNPGTIFLDHQRFDKEIPVTTNWEAYLEVLPDAESVTSTSQLAVFVRGWHPNSYRLDPFQEIVLEKATIDSLISKISDISGIPKESVEFAKGQGIFPYEISLLSIHKELDWHNHKSTICAWSLNAEDDGYVVYYRDSREELKELTEDEKREITNQENVRSKKVRKTSCTSKKEKALKIYTYSSPSLKESSNSNILAINSTESTKLVVPDLD